MCRLGTKVLAERIEFMKQKINIKGVKDQCSCHQRLAPNSFWA